MTRDEAADVIVALARGVLAHVPAADWSATARMVSLELLKLSGERRTESGAFRLDDDRDTLRPPKP